jgi:hypothetical protein
MSEPARDHRTRTRGGRIGLALAAVALVAAVFAGGYAVGASRGQDLAAARDDGRADGARRGSAAGERSGTAAGAARSRRAGYRAAYQPAYKRAYRKAEKAVDEQSALPAAGQPTSCAPGLVSAANGCVSESEARCAAYQDFVPGQGCVPPLAPGAVEAEPQCPPGQVPVGITGACARP